MHEDFGNMALGKLMGGTAQPSFSFWSFWVFTVYCIASWRTLTATWAGCGFSITWEKIVLGLSDVLTRLGLFCSMLVQYVFLVWLPAKYCTAQSCSVLVLMTTVSNIAQGQVCFFWKSWFSRSACVGLYLVLFRVHGSEWAKWQISGKVAAQGRDCRSNLSHVVN